MQRFGLFFYDRLELTVLLWVTILVFGVLSYGVFMKRQGFPAVDVPVSVVSGTYFVNDPARLDREVTAPASAVISRVPGVKTITSTADANFFNIIVEFDEQATSRSGTTAVKQALEDSRQLPAQASVEYRPIDGTKYADKFEMLVSVYQTSENPDIRMLEGRAEAIADELEKHEGVGRAEVMKQFRTGVNPLTGEQAIQRQTFDRLGVRQKGRTVFYESVTIGIVGESGQDALHLSENVYAALGELAARDNFDDVSVKVSADFAESIEEQISGLQQNLLEGLFAVLVVSVVLLSWRAGIVSAVAMLVVISATLAALYASGNTLNTVTLFALILSLGLIVDDTIIKVEAIDAAKQESRRRRNIIALAAGRVSLASVAGTLTTMLGFAPMLFVSGILGEFIRILPITVIIALALSLLVSLILVPPLSGLVILRGWPRKTVNPIPRLERLVSGGLARLLRVGKRSRAKGAAIGTTAVLIGLIFIISSLPFFQKLKFDIFPATKDTDTIRVGLRFPPGTSIEAAQNTSDRANELIGDVLAGNLSRLSYQSSGGSMEASATVDLVSYKQRKATSPELVAWLDKAFEGFKGAEIKVSQVDVGPPAEDLPFRLQIRSEDRDEASRLAADVAAFLRGREIERASGTKARVTLAEVAAPAQITRIDGQQVVETQAGFDADDTSALVIAAQTSVENEFTPEKLSRYGLDRQALTFDFGSESENQDSFRSMLVAFPVLIAAMYLLMAVQFKSLLQPLLIFSAIPYSFFGVAVGLYVTDNPLSFFVLVGFFALIGIAVNNTILLTDYANQGRAAGMGRIDAIATAVGKRFRPLLVTSLTSVVALTPLALSDPFWESLSYTLIFGLLSSTFLVLITFPYVYLGGEALRIFGSSLWHRHLPKPVQYPLDVLIAPARLADAVIHLVFRATPRGKRRLP